MGLSQVQTTSVSLEVSGKHLHVFLTLDLNKASIVGSIDFPEARKIVDLDLELAVELPTNTQAQDGAGGWLAVLFTHLDITGKGSA